MDDALVGSRIREYQILEILGKGGMGCVYRARHVYLDEDRAVKVINARLAGDVDFIERFIREAKILTKLRHPNLVQLHEFGTLQEDTFFMVMELITGESVLQRIVRMERLPIADSIKIIREAARGLYSAHQKGIIHRDISPDNLILTTENDGSEVTKVIDFGIAKPLFESSSHRTSTNIFVGKPEYCSPEQCGLLEEGEFIDARSDIYSLAVSLYHMITGKLPFNSPTPAGYLLKHANETPRPPSAHFAGPGFPRKLDALIVKALSKQRSERHASMEEFINDLDGLIEGPVPPVQPLSAGGYPLELRLGELFARRYFIEKKLGHGGMGVVYKAIDKLLEVPVALKIISSAIVQDAITAERLRREVVLCRKISHPAVCRIFDIGESAGVHYISMEFIEGKTLAEMLRQQGRLTTEIGVPIIIQVVLALQEAHRLGIVHRDLKPQNIVVDLDLKAHILDFGVSISIEANRVTQTGALVGTPDYMAPEQFEGKNIDHRSDIYSVGAILFEMFTGRRPFEADSALAIIYAHLKLDPPTPTSIAKDIPEELERIILKALQKEAKNRYQSVRDLYQDLQPLLAPTTSLSRFNHEQAAHKLLAEQNYSKAIKFISRVIKTDPSNPRLTKLLIIATTEKINRDLRRARRLVQKKNLIQAQFLVERMNRLHPENTKLVSQVRKLEIRLSEEREKAVVAYLEEATKNLQSNNPLAALTCLESAWNLKPNDSRIVVLQEKAQSYQEDGSIQRIRQEVKNARAFFEQGADDECERILQNILKESPEEPEAIKLQDELQARRLSQKVQDVFECLTSFNFAHSASLLADLTAETKRDVFRSELLRIGKGLEKIATAFNQGRSGAVGEAVKELLDTDEFGWLEPKRAGLLGVISAAEQIEKRKIFESAFQNANEEFKKGQWLKSIEYCQEALKLSPADPAVAGRLIAAQKNLATEEKAVRHFLLTMERARELTVQKKFEDAKILLTKPYEALSFPSKTEELTRTLSAIRQMLEREIARENERIAARQKQIDEIRRLLSQEQYEQALARVEQLSPAAKNDSEIESLKTEILEMFRTAILNKGQKLYANQQWEEAIECWEGGERYFRGDASWGHNLAEARAELNREYQIARTVLIKFQDFERSVAAKDLKNAANVLSESQEMLNQTARLSELKGLLNKHIATLAREREKEEAIRRENDDDSVEETLSLDNEPQTAPELFAKGQKYFEDLNWRKAKLYFERAYDLSHAETVKAWLIASRDRFQAEQQIRKELRSKLRSCRDLIERRMIQEAARILDLCDSVILSGFDLSDLREEMSSLRNELASGEVPTTPGTVEDTVPQSSLFYQLDAVIEALIEEKITTVVSMLPQFEMAGRNSIEENEVRYLSTELRLIAEAISSVDFRTAVKKLQLIIQEAALLRPYHAKLQQLMVRLREKEKAEAEFAQLFQDALHQITAKDWGKACSLLEKLNQVYPNKSQVQGYLSLAVQKRAEQTRHRKRLLFALERSEEEFTNGNFDSAVQICENALQYDCSDLLLTAEIKKLSDALSSYRSHRINLVLTTADQLLQSGQFNEAIKRLEDILKWDPANHEAREGLNQAVALRDSLVPSDPIPEDRTAILFNPRIDLKRTGSDLKIILALGIPLFIFLVLAGVWILSLSERTLQASRRLTRITPKQQAAPLLTVRVNAVPWARVEVFARTAALKLPALSEEQRTTPCILRLPPGDYRLELDNGVAHITQSITISAGSANSFFYRMPQYDPIAAILQIETQ